jgi:predicted helicase
MTKNKNLAQVLHYDLQGKRDAKYDFLNQNSLASIVWNTLEPNEPNYFFVPKNFDEIKSYEKGFKIDELFGENVAGIETIRDAITIHFKAENLKNVVNDFLNLDEVEIAKKYNTEDARDWKIGRAKEDVKLNINNPGVWQEVNYRPFDTRKTFYSGKQNGFVCNGRYNVMRHLLKDNLGFIAKRGFDELNSAPCFLTKNISDRRGWSRPGMQGAESIFPLYLYPETTSQQTIDSNIKRIPNLNEKIVDEIAEKINHVFLDGNSLVDLSAEAYGTFTPEDILDYIYAVLHSPTYREKYKEFLKIDFPRVPYPKSAATFWQLVTLGGELRQIHLLESPIVEKYITQYPIDGNNVVSKPRFVSVQHDNKNGKVFINDTQYFDNVPEVAWTFFIGGYQPAQKWLKDRKERTLEFDDILHYQKIIVALSETSRLMQAIDKINIE